MWLPFARFHRLHKLKYPLLDIPVSDMDPIEMRYLLKFIYAGIPFVFVVLSSKTIPSCLQKCLQQLSC